MSSNRLTTGLVILVKLLITAGLMWLVFSKVDLAATADRITLINPLWALAAILVLMATFACGTARSGYLLEMFGEKLDFPRMFRISFIGAFFSQALVTFLSGDAMRVWCLTREGIPLLKSASTILLDRATGIIAIAVLLFATLPSLLDIVKEDVMRFSILALAGMCLFAIVLFVVLGFARPSQIQSRPVLEALSNLASVSRHVWRMPGLFWRALGFSIAIHIGNTFAIYLLSLGFGGMSRSLLKM